MTADRAPERGSTAYLYDNARQGERDRLAALERGLDAGTVRHLESLGVGTGWRCLEVGAGGGSIARWLCRRVGPAGSVLATDIDPRFLGALDEPNLEVRRHDILTDALPAGAFDLVHCRLVLMHLPEPDRALARMVAALKPGGWLLAEEQDYVSMVPDPDADTRAAALFGKVERAFQQLRDGTFGRRLYRSLRAQGLVTIGTEGRSSLYEGGPTAPFIRRAVQARATLVASGSLTGEEIDEYICLLQDPNFIWMGPTVMAAWGRRRGGADLTGERQPGE